MYFPPDVLVFGLVAPRILIDCAKQLHDRDDTFDLDDFCRALGAPLEESRPVLLKLVADGFATESGDETYFSTQKLGQLALAKISNGLPRREADRLLGMVVAKATEINARKDDQFRKIACLVAFGSYLTDQPVIGDLDLAVALRDDPRDRPPRERQSIAEWLHEGMAPSRRTYAALRLRQPKHISVHTLEEVLGLGTPYRVVWGAMPAMTRR